MAGWLLQWPTIPTLIMFPILAIVYARLARSEEREVATDFGSRLGRLQRPRPPLHPALPEDVTAIQPGPYGQSEQSHRGGSEDVTESRLIEASRLANTYVTPPSTSTSSAADRLSGRDVLVTIAVQKTFSDGMWPLRRHRQVSVGRTSS